MRHNLLEWFLLGVSAVAIVLVSAFLTVEGLGTEKPADPRVSLRIEDARGGNLGWIVPAEVTNDGDEAAEAAVIEATALIGGREESSELTVDFVPGRSTVEVEFAFSAVPDGEIEVRLIGFRRP